MERLSIVEIIYYGTENEPVEITGVVDVFIDNNYLKIILNDGEIRWISHKVIKAFIKKQEDKNERS